MPLQPLYFLLLLYISLPSPFHALTDRQEQYFTLMKDSLSGSTLSGWVNNSYCNYYGITCNNRGYVTKIEMSGWSLSGYFPPKVCSYLPELRVLDISSNEIQGNFPDSIINCSSLRALNMSSLYLTGKLPNFRCMKSLRVLDLSYNQFHGDFPESITNLTGLEIVNFNENSLFNYWELPENISRLTNLKEMVLSRCSLHGHILTSIGSMTSLVDLELSQNFLHGPIPPELGRLKNLKVLMLYYNQLTGAIPHELGNLTALTELDMSMNSLTGEIPESLSHLPKLHTLQLYNNSLTGGIPKALGKSKTLAFFSLYANHLIGEVPKNLGKFSPLILLDLSENQLSGQLPPDICSGGRLVYLLLLQNMFTGEIPWNKYAECTSLLRFRVSYNRLEGSIPEKLFFLPHASIIDLGFNQLTGPIPKTIGNAKNLSELFIPNNRISGVLPPEIAKTVNLVKIDLSNNILYGPVPSQIGSLEKLNLLLLQGNKFNSSIPKSLSLLKSLNLLDLSENQLTGAIPPSLSALLPNPINFSHNLLSGPIPLPFIMGGQEESFLGNPHLCVTAYLNSSDAPFPLCSQTNVQKKLNRIWVVAISLALVSLVIILFLKQCITKKRTIIGHDKTFSSSFSSYDVKSFHQVSFDQREILEAMVDKNVFGHGGSGTVYRIGLSSGELVAVKKLWSQRQKAFSSEEQLFPDKELETEVETLGSVRHKNIVKLYSYFSSWDCHLLVYEYMPNGNLWDALHKGKLLLDWPTRHQIALGIAQGIAYLHHDLLPPIIHRDIKTSNILLDINYQPKVADFGVAKVLQARGGKESSHTVVIAGTCGYLDPDYVSSSRATTKCDVYSYGVVLMELVTGKKPVEPEFGENKNIINWIASQVETKEGAIDVLDKQLAGTFKEEMIKLLQIAIRCTARAPAPRPTMKEVVQLLTEAEPCRFDSFKSVKKTEDAPMTQKYMRN